MRSARGNGRGRERRRHFCAHAISIESIDQLLVGGGLGDVAADEVRGRELERRCE